MINSNLKKKKFEEYFYKAIIVAVSVSLLTLVFRLSTVNLLLFSCLGASAVILVNQKKYSHSSLGVVIKSYVLTGIIALVILNLYNFLNLTFTSMVFSTMLISFLALYLTKSIHPPAIGSGLAFLIFERSIYELGILLICVLTLLSLINFMMSLYYKNDKIKNFFKKIF